MLIRGYDPRFLKMCVFATLSDLGYGTRICVTNGFVGPHPPRDRVDVAIEFHDADGNYLATFDDVVSLEPGDQSIVNIGDWTRALGAPQDVLGVLTMRPARFRDVDSIDVEMIEIFDHIAITDEFVDYYSADGRVVGTVAYQSVPMNDVRFGGSRSTLMQSPKIIVGDDIDTHILVMNPSTYGGYATTVPFRLILLAGDGRPLAHHCVDVPPLGFRRVSTRQMLTEAGKLEEFASQSAGMVVGYSDAGSVVPLSITRHDRSGSLTCDHTLPPTYYLPWWGGSVRAAANANLREVLFGDSATTGPGH